MRLDPERLPAELARGLAPRYLLFGDEPLLLQEARDAIRAAASSAGIDERQLVAVEREADWQRIALQSASLGLFATRRLFDVRLDRGVDAGAEKALLRLAEQSSADDVLIVSTPPLTKAAQAKPFVAAFERHGVVVQFWPVRAAELPRWLDARAKRLGVALERDALTFLAHQVEGNLLAAAQQLDLLRLLGPGPYGVDDLARAFDDAARFEVFGLFDAACSGDAERLLDMLAGLAAEGEGPLPIALACASQLRRLLALQAKVAAGEPFARAASSSGVFGRERTRAWEQACRRLPAAAGPRLLLLLGVVDQRVKGLRRGDPWQPLCDALLVIAGRTPRTAATLARGDDRTQPVGMR